jgi:hypothetical protein
VADYNSDFLTLSYNGRLCQLPTSYLPNQFHQQPIAVQQHGKVKRLPFGQAKKLLLSLFLLSALQRLVQLSTGKRTRPTNPT